MADARWRIEMDYRELKDELVLDHFEGHNFEGRHWLGCVVSKRDLKKLLVGPCRKCAGGCNES